MRIRTTLILTAIVSSILGAIVVYLILSVPNDLRADALLKQARQDLGAGKTADASAALTKIVQQYPRTDAAAAATVALVSIGESERQKLQRELAAVKSAHEKLIGDLQKSVTEIKNAPPPKPQVIIQQAPPKPAPKPTPKKKTPVRKKR